ncbi:hypothetical protein [Treponema pedis]|uniref:Lipoprotein n=1 Tax=Treponema pedis str. T A4 TaxID=1291379 RepID=S5ZN33_9SPIR|nr:hypothetical protein [Treponema pedis]AGT44002.1 hypothetical protein TPE_1507 [Treponema pedis str. T A4]
MKKTILIAGVLVLVSAVFFTGCPDKYEEATYTKENITLKFKNATDKTCYVEIKGKSKNVKGVAASISTEGFESEIDFPAVLKTEVPNNQEKKITVKDVVTSGKTSKKTKDYYPVFEIKVTSDDGTGGYDVFYSDSKDQYTGGTFKIEKKNGNNYFTIEFSN